MSPAPSRTTRRTDGPTPAVPRATGPDPSGLLRRVRHLLRPDVVAVVSATLGLLGLGFGHAGGPWAVPAGVGLLGLAAGSVLSAWQLRRADRDALHAQRLATVGVLAGGVAHDLNNLLTAVQGQADLAAAAAAGTPAADHAHRARAAAVRCADLARHLLALAGRSGSVFEPVDLAGVVRETVDLVTAAVPKTVRFQVDAPPGLPPVGGDATELRQVVLNIVLNAAEAIGLDPGTVTTRVRREGGEAVVTVADTGRGMDARTEARMFDPFFTTKPTGRGLGLSAVREIVTGHGGTIGVTSGVGRGTTVTVRVPLAAFIPAEETTPAPVGGTDPDRPDDERPIVLIVEDEEAVRAVLLEFLVQLGWAVLTAEGGREAVELFRQSAGRVKLVVLDLSLPDMTGEETLARLRAVDPGVPVLVSTGQSSDSRATVAVADEVSGVLLKPWQRPDLAAAVAHAVATAGARSPAVFGARD